MPPLQRATPFDVSKLVFVGALWGASFIFMAYALKSFGPLSVTAWRVSLAAVVLLIVATISRKKLPQDRNDWGKIIIISIFNSALPFFLISWGLQTTSTAEAALLMATGTFFALILSHFTTQDERINLPRAIGVTLGFAGVLVLVITELLQTGIGGLKGQLAIMGAATSYAISSVLTRRISHISSIPSAACIMLAAALYMLPIAFIFESPLNPNATTLSILSLVLLGVMATALAFAIRVHIIKKNGAIFTTQVGYLVPLFGVIWSWLFLADPIGTQTLIALGVILIGIAITRTGTKA